MNNKPFPKCDICGERTTSAAFDVREIPNDSAWRIYESYGRPRYGCDNHPPRKSRTYLIGDKDYPLEKIK